VAEAGNDEHALPEMNEGNEMVDHILPMQQRKFTKQELDKTPWRYWLPKLEEYKAKFGHLNPPFSNGEHHDLACWIFYLRSQRKKGKPMPEQLVHNLDAIGFDWHQEPGPGRRAKKNSGRGRKRKEVTSVN